jgi:hypothetical protein
VAAGAGDGDAEAEAAEGAGDGGVVASAFEDDGGGDAGAVGAAFEEMTHAAEVALAFFAYVGGEEDGDWGLDAGVTEGGGDGEEAGEAGGVVADAGSEDAGAAGVFDWVAGCAGAEDGVEVSGDEEAGGTGGGGRRREELGEDVAFVVEVGVGEAELVEAVKEPGGAVVLCEGGRGDADEFKLPLTELRLVEMEPVEGAMDWGEAGEAGDSTLSGGGRHQEMTSGCGQVATLFR